MSIKFRKPNGRVVCLHCHRLPNGDIDCSYFGQVVTKECCEECKGEGKAEKCKHIVLELVEQAGDVFWMRCAKCFVLFEFTKKEFKQLKEAEK